MAKLKVLFASPEVVPFAKTGGLADVSGKLPKVIADYGHDVKVFLPRYSSISPLLLKGLIEGPSIDVQDGTSSSVARLVRLPDSDRPFETVFIDYPRYFDRSELYVDPETGLDYVDNARRFAFFSRSILESVKALDWRPDVIHANDWQSALIPAYLKTVYRNDSFFNSIRMVFTIHNMGYQGIFAKEDYSLLNLSEDLFYPTGPFEFWDRVNLMKSAIYYADIISTVSERYAVEIQSSEEYGYGLENVLRERSQDLYGIVNGVDYEVWSPSIDRLIPYRYNSSNLAGKRKNKVELVHSLDLPFRDNALLIGMITRLADQKGLDIFALAADRILALNLQMIILGTGDKVYHELLSDLAENYPRKLKVVLAYDNDLAHLIEAGADAFLMPSRYEPCGLNQMYSLKYGTVPIVRETGGLADTVDDVVAATGTGTGFVFKEYDPEALLEAVKRAVEMFRQKRLWKKIVKAGMAKDYSWAASAAKYVDLYHTALNKERN